MSSMREGSSLKFFTLAYIKLNAHEDCKIGIVDARVDGLIVVAQALP